MLKGIPVSEGIGIGKVWILDSPWDEVVAYKIEDGMVVHEVKRYKEALRDVAMQLIDCKNRVEQEIGEEEAYIFEAHLEILRDSFFQEEIIESIQKTLTNAEFILKEAIDRWIASFEKLSNEYFRHRVDDIKDVSIRLLRSLLRSEDVKFPLDEPAILIAHSLTPSDTARIDRDKILGFATELGGSTSHASILARSMGLPAVVGVERLMKTADMGHVIIVDGNAGIVYVDPAEDVIESYKKRQKQFNAYLKRLSEDIELPSVTRDNVEVSLQANVSMTADASMAIRYRADGIGLFRTELPFLSTGRLLTEEEQFKIYRTIVESMSGKIVTIRTLDLGGDKFLPFQGIEEESNPFLGWRSIRISLQEQDIFKAQLRAILRASHHGNVRILFPMISSLDEIVEIRNVLEETKKELRVEGIPFDEHMKEGIMIEVPSAAILADRLTRHTHHFSIGTNDLIQYTLAVDRNNEKVAKFYQPLNPAILHLIHHTIRAGHEAGISVALCGEMAGNPLYTAILLGFGLREFSMSPLMLPEVKERIRAVTIQECEELAMDVLSHNSVEEIVEMVWDFHRMANSKQDVPSLQGEECYDPASHGRDNAKSRSKSS